MSNITKRLTELRDERSSIINLADKAKTEAWKLHVRLGGSYDNTNQQMEDMKKMGDLASAHQQLHDAAWKYFNAMEAIDCT